MGFLALKELQAAGDLPQGPPWRHDSHFVVLFWLAKFQSDKEGWAWPSLATLARLGKKSRRQVIRIVQELEADHLIEVSRQRYQNRYRLRIPTRPSPLRGVTYVTGDAGVTSSRDMVTPASEVVSSTPNLVTPEARDGDTAVSPELKGTDRTEREQRGAAAPVGVSDLGTADERTGASPSAEQRQHLELIRERLGLRRVG